MARILVVEDEHRLAAAIRRGLCSQGYAVDIAATGTDGRWLAEQGSYDAIVLDVVLPPPDGLEICTGLRSAGIWIPILMLTARDAPGDVARALDTGADDYLAKPFSFMVLLARLRALLRRGGPRRPPVFEAGDLRLDPASHRCLRGESEVELTSREFAVLEFLMRNTGTVVSKAEILDHVWDFAFDGDPNIVEVYIRRLRRKLDEPFARHTIHTIRGEGYRLADDDG